MRSTRSAGRRRGGCGRCGRFRDRLALGDLEADLACEVTARMRNSSVTIFSRTSERTRAISAISVDRLGEEIVGAGLQAAHAVGRLVERGDHHHRNVVRGRIGS